METTNNLFSILKQADFNEIASQTKYSQAYVRQCIRGYQKETKFNREIYDRAREIANNRIKMFQ